MFRDERMPTHPVHRTQSLLVGGAKAARPQVVYTVLHVVLKPEKETERLDSFLKATEPSSGKCIPGGAAT